MYTNREFHFHLTIFECLTVNTTTRYAITMLPSSCTSTTSAPVGTRTSSEETSSEDTHTMRHVSVMNLCVLRVLYDSLSKSRVALHVDHPHIKTRALPTVCPGSTW